MVHFSLSTLVWIYRWGLSVPEIFANQPKPALNNVVKNQALQLFLEDLCPEIVQKAINSAANKYKEMDN